MAADKVSDFARLGSDTAHLLSYKAPRSNRRPETSSRIQRRPGVVDARELCHEQCQTDSYWRDKRVFRFLSGQHQNDEDKERSKEHLDEYTLSDGNPWRQCSLHG